MKSEKQAPRAIALVLGFALIRLSFGAQAWAQAVPRVAGFSACVGGGSAALASAGAQSPTGLVVPRMAAEPVAAVPAAASAVPALPVSAIADAPAAAPAPNDGSIDYDGGLGRKDAFVEPLSRVALLDTSTESLDARAALVSSARRTVYAGYFEFFPDEAGLATLALLRDAARRGLKARLLLDAWGNHLPAAMLKHLSDEGVEVRLYHPFRLGRPSWIWRRAHDKWTIADGEGMILGDSNMANYFFGMGKNPWRTREAYVAGPAAREGQAYAEKIWSSGEAANPRGLEGISSRDAAAASRRLDAADLERRKRPVDASSRPWEERARLASVRFTSNAFRRPHRSAGTGEELLRLIRRAKRTIVIENAYVVLPKAFKTELERAIRERGVRVVIVTNSYGTNNKILAREAYAANVPMLVEMGVELYEFKGPGTLHAKSLIVDGERAYLGSFNLDPRSFMLNTETGVIVDGRGFARDLLRGIERTLLDSVLVGREGAWMSPPRSRWKALLRRPLLTLIRRQI